jgi:hypothetical protein
MSSSPYEDSSEMIDAFLAEIDAQQAEITAEYDEIQAGHNRNVDTVIAALVETGANIQPILRLRESIGETSGIEITVQRILDIEKKLAAAPEISDPETIARRGLVRQQVIKAYYPAFVIEMLASHLTMRELMKSGSYSRQDAEAMIITHELLSEADKPAYLAAIKIFMDEEGLSSDNPDSFVYVEKFQANKTREEQAFDESRANYRRLGARLDMAKIELNIPDHDDLPTVTQILLTALGSVAVDPNKQTMLRETGLDAARGFAQRIGWNDELFDEVVARMQAD